MRLFYRGAKPICECVHSSRACSLSLFVCSFFVVCFGSLASNWNEKWIHLLLFSLSNVSDSRFGFQYQEFIIVHLGQLNFLNSCVSIFNKNLKILSKFFRVEFSVFNNCVVFSACEKVIVISAFWFCLVIQTIAVVVVFVWIYILLIIFYPF